MNTAGRPVHRACDPTFYNPRICASNRRITGRNRIIARFPVMIVTTRNDSMEEIDDN